MDTDFGQRSPVDLVQGGVSAFARGMEGHAERQRQEGLQKAALARNEAEQNRALHPLAQKYFAEVAAGRMTPAEASVAAHHEIDANNNGIPDVQEQGILSRTGSQGQALGSQPTADMPGAPAEAEARTIQIPVERGFDRPPQGLRQAAQAPAPQQQPLRQRDLPTLELMAKTQQANRPASGLSYDQRVGLEGVKQGGQQVLEGKRQEGRERIAGQKAGYFDRAAQAQREGKTADLRETLAARWREKWLEHLDRLEGFKTRIAQAGTGAEAVRIRAEASKYAANVRGAAGIRSSIPELAQDPEAMAFAAELEEKVRGLAQEVTTPAPAPQGPAPAPQPIKGPVPAPQFKTGKTEGFKMKFPDGSVHTVTADKLAAAKARGGVPAP